MHWSHAARNILSHVPRPMPLDPCTCTLHRAFARDHDRIGRGTQTSALPETDLVDYEMFPSRLPLPHLYCTSTAPLHVLQLHCTSTAPPLHLIRLVCTLFLEVPIETVLGQNRNFGISSFDSATCKKVDFLGLKKCFCKKVFF